MRVCANGGDWGVLDGWGVVECLRHYAECRRESAAKVWWKSAAKAKEQTKNGVKDVVRMVAFCGLQNSYARRRVNFWYNGWQKEFMQHADGVGQRLKRAQEIAEEEVQLLKERWHEFFD